MLSTKAKLRIARALNRAIIAGRRVGGLGEIAYVRRGGIAWRLDLNEGIDLAIFLGIYQSIPAHVKSLIPPGSTVIDVGANIGAFALPLAAHLGPGGKVIAVEPTNYAFAKLKTNVSLNSQLLDRIVPVQAALNDGASTDCNSAFYSSWSLLELSASARHNQHLGRKESASDARFLKLDQLVSEFCSAGPEPHRVVFVKLDVDGNELAVLRGGADLLRKTRPVILIEIAPYVQDEVAGRFDDLIQLLVDCRYRLEHPGSRKALPLSSNKLRKLISPGASMDLAAIPEQSVA
jgi:FkbM family methyltransferase